jgi:formylglycine-generating enzyme required for sulfatase activity
MAFADYYGWRLPTEWEWQAVADYDGSYTYGCGTTINQSKANYQDSDYANPLNLSSVPYTSPVGYYPAYGYGMCDMAGNVWEWTDSCYYGDCHRNKRLLRSGGWDDSDGNCEVSSRYGEGLDQTNNGYYGFRVCR